MTCWYLAISSAIATAEEIASDSSEVVDEIPIRPFESLILKVARTLSLRL